MLLFTKTGGFRHDSIPAGITAIQQLGTAHHFTVVQTEDAAQFTAASLATYDAVIFLHSTGELLNAAQQTAFEQYIQSGGGFVGIHAAADAEYSWPWYGQLVGAYFANHPATQPATVLMLDRSHPSTKNSPQRWARTDEWYNFQTNPRGNVHVLATLDETTYSGGTMGHDHPIAWCQNFDGGRSWYSALGHTTESFAEPDFLAHLLGGIEWAAGKEPGDAGATIGNRFEKVVLDDNVNDPMALEVAPDGRVFFVERGGKVKVYHPSTQATTVAGTLPVFTGLEDGLLGLALDPNFATNGWIYLYHSPNNQTPGNMLSRFTVIGDQLDLSSQKVLLQVPTQRTECCHSGGGMEFGPDGSLYLSIGDNTNPFASDGFAPIDEQAGRSAWDAQTTSGNTNDLRGKILRITPQPDGTYSIPAGNLFPAGTPLTRPEIFTMGNRNPFRIAVDPFTGYLYWGEVGPDAGGDSATRGPRGYDEVNQARTSGNYGWPYLIGNNFPYRDFNYPTSTPGGTFNPAAPLNASPNNTGLGTLPATRGAFVWYPYATSTEFPAIRDGSGRTMMAGAVYRHVPGASDSAFPAYYDRTLFLMEWARNHLYEVKTDANGNLLKLLNFAPNLSLSRPMDLTFGPDGAMYLIEWGTGFGGSNPDAQIVKIVYDSGNLTPLVKVAPNTTSGSLPLAVQFSSAGTFDPDPGDTLTFAWDFDLDGTVDSTAPDPAHTYLTAGNFTAQLRVTDSRGKSASASVGISAGNAAPAITFLTPPEGSFFDWDDEVGWQLRVDDAEGGGTETGAISGSDVRVEFVLGHASHGHGLGEATGTSGKTVAGSSHEFGDDLFFAFLASYTDGGAPGVAPTTGTRTAMLQPKVRQAEHATTLSGVTVTDTTDAAGSLSDVTAIDHSDYIAFTPMNLWQISEVSYRVEPSVAGSRVEVHAGSPTGPLLSTATFSPSGAPGFRHIAAPITDPGGTHELFFVFKRNPGDTNLFRLNWICFHGNGATRVARAPRISAVDCSAPFNSITLKFDDLMDETWLSDPANYSLNQSTVVTSAIPAPDLRSVRLNTSTLNPAQGYILSVRNVRDLAGNAIAHTQRPFRPQSVVRAINCSGGDFTSASGTVFTADQFYTGGNGAGTSDPIAGTSDDAIYQNERWGDFTYAIPLANGSYAVTLMFSETFFNANGQRVFSMSVEGVPVVSNLDIHAVVGHDTALDFSTTVVVTDGVLNISSTASVNNAKLDGLIVRTSGEPFGDFPSWQTFYFGSPGGINAGPQLDPEHDGLSNWLEYALGGDPLWNDAALLAPTLESPNDASEPGKLTFRYRKAVPALFYRAQWSPSLGSTSWSGSGFEPELYHAPTHTYQRSLSVPLGETKKFLRLEVSDN
ncbi:MAG: ThuA domain-containing protein [Verrucomicrobiota bacterium]